MLNTLCRTSRYEHNLITNEAVYQVKLEIDAKGIQDGFIKAVGGPTAFAVLLCIYSHTNEKGEAFPSQETLVKELGITSKTIRAVIDELETVEIEGNKVLVKTYREPTMAGKFKSSLYTVNQIVKSPEAVETVIPPTEKGLTAKDVIGLFTQAYTDTFDEVYSPSWGRDGKLVKTKLLDVLDDDTVRAVVHTSVTEYTKRWGNKNYPRPSIAMVCGWLGNAAQAIISEKDKVEEKFETNSSWDFAEQQRIAEKYL